VPTGFDTYWHETSYKQGILEYIDAVSIHPYRAGPPESLAEDFRRLRALTDGYAPPGKAIRILSSEWGYANPNWDGSFLDEATRARYLVRGYILQLSQYASMAFWYGWKNDMGFQLVSDDLSPKPAYLALKTLTANFRGYRITGRLDLGAPEDYAFSLENGPLKALVLWTAGGPHRTALRLPPSRGSWLSLYGQRTPVSWSADTLGVALSADPGYLILNSALALSGKAAPGRTWTFRFAGRRIAFTGPANLRSARILRPDGRQVAFLAIADGMVAWDGRDARGMPAARGPFFLEARGPGFVKSYRIPGPNDRDL
jgi:hypothetical protein